MTEVSVQDLAAHVGREFGPSDWLRIDQQRIDDFARVTGDNHWMHVDVERATREASGTIAHGLLILSLLPLLGETCFKVAGYTGGYSYGYDRLRFTQPVKSGSRVRLRQRLDSVTEKAPGQLVRLASTIEIESVECPALVVDSLSLYFR